MWSLQKCVYEISLGRIAGWLKWVTAVLAIVALAATCALRLHQGFPDETMDQAQLARNWAEGRGFTTQIVRPFALHLLTAHAVLTKQMPEPPPAASEDLLPANARTLSAVYWPDPMPEITHAPAYPLLLGALFKLPGLHSLLATDAGARWFRPDLVIIVFNQLLLIASAILVFLLTNRFFGRDVAWFALVLFLISETFWLFAVSGLATNWLVFLVLGICGCLERLEELADRDYFTGPWQWCWAAALGLLLALCALTCYALIPLGGLVAVYLLLGRWRHRVWLCLLMLVIFAGLVAPWLVRNYQLSGTLFGTAAYATYQGTATVPDGRLERALDPNQIAGVTAKIEPDLILAKLRSHFSRILITQLPRVGVGWPGLLFWLTLLFPFRSAAPRRLRNFVLAGVVLLALAQALIQTRLGEMPDEISSENLLVLFYPLALIFGAGLFFKLLHDTGDALIELRGLFIISLVAATGLPLAIALWNGGAKTPTHPADRPALIQGVARWFKPNEILVTDAPGEFAWYGNRTCVWLPMGLSTEFLALHNQRPVHGLFLTHRTLDNRFVSQWQTGENQGWGSFLATALVRSELPAEFPLRTVFNGLLPEYLLFSDTNRWQLTTSP